MFPAPAALSVSQTCLFSFQQHLQQLGSSSVRPASSRMSSTRCRHFPGSTVQSAPPSQSRPLMQPHGYTMSLKDVPLGGGSRGTSEGSCHLFISSLGQLFPATSVSVSTGFQLVRQQKNPV